MNSKKGKRTAKEALTRYLGMRMRTEDESRNYLEEKGYEPDEIQDAITEFLQLGYLDDADYARVYCEYAYGKGRGRIRIAGELKQRGVDAETVRNAIEDYLYEEGIDEVELARRWAKKVLVQNLPQRPEITESFSSEEMTGEDPLNGPDKSLLDTEEHATKTEARERTVRKARRSPDSKLEAKIARKLEQQGYSTSIILQVLSEVRSGAISVTVV